MKINSIINHNYGLNTAKYYKVSFGEYDGDDYSYTPRHRMTNAQYETRKDIINDKYDSMRSSWLNNCDDLELSNTAVWRRLNEIEKMRNNALFELESEYRR